MTGSAEARADQGARRSPNEHPRPRRYVAVDGGAGAHLLATLPSVCSALRPVASPRHADLLIVVGPVASKLTPAMITAARALPRPARALIVDGPAAEGLLPANIADLGAIFPGARRVASCVPRAVGAAALDGSEWRPLEVGDGEPAEPATISLPSKAERELHTELAVLSLGPLQPFTAGPLRLALVCDGEQVLTAEVDAGFAHRGIALAMLRADWRGAGAIARHVDPLAPIAGQLAYAHALERLQGVQPSRPVAEAREAALAIERAQNFLWWLARFAGILEARVRADGACHLAEELTDATGTLWDEPPGDWLAPGAAPPRPSPEATSRVESLAREVAALHDRLGRDRLLALRCRRIGALDAGQVRSAGASGPVLRASEQASGDVWARVLARSAAAAEDLRDAARRLRPARDAGAGAARWDAPRGEATVSVEGPRGRIGLRLGSDGGSGPSAVSWNSPSAALLGVLPGLLADQTLADAEVIVASLDLSMAEADG